MNRRSAFFWSVPILDRQQLVALHTYKRRCLELYQEWPDILSEEVTRGWTAFVSDAVFLPLKAAADVFGVRIYNPRNPVFREGDGLNYNGIPGTVVQVLENGDFEVCWDQIYQCNDRVLFEPCGTQQTTTFSRDEKNNYHPSDKVNKTIHLYATLGRKNKFYHAM